MNPNTPVIVGIAQLQQRVASPELSKEPIELMVDAVRLAAEDTGHVELLSEVGSVRVVRGMWKYHQPAGYVAEKIGCPNAEKVGTCYGGNMVQSALNATALDILNGDQSLVVLAGAEIGNSQAKARKAGIELPLTKTVGEYDRMIGVEESMSCDAEKNRGIFQPIQVYPMFENALRHQMGRSIEDHQQKVSELWAGFSRVASKNPHAWIKEEQSAETIRTKGARNRMVSFPYPKLMNSNNAVDMSAAIILCSVKKARELGIDEALWVYPWAGTDAHDTYYLSNRDNLYSSPAIRIAGRRVLELAGLTVPELDFVDVYSCFPSAVQVAVNELGLDASKPLTVTGGLTFGGGPLNNYVMHSIARMVEVLRQNPGKKGLVTANGGFLTKHAFGVYSTQSPQADYQHQDVQTEVDACPTRDVAPEFEGEATLESYTVMFDGDKAVVGHAACLTPDGRRTWANTSDQNLIALMQTEEFCGKSVEIDSAGEFRLLSA
ncbi:MAG: acetyl-CoA C-acetyltransferase [Candidatus Azotimanducaceae bacterium]